MTAQEALKRNEKAQSLKVWQVDETWYYVESEEGKIAYKCCVSDKGDYCNCGDFASHSKNDPNFKCKHILAVLNSIPRGEVNEARILEKRKPKLDERFVKQVDGKDFALYVGLLDLAHQKNLVSMEVDLVQIPTKENEHTAICRATGKTAGGGLFIDVGDANPINCNSKVAKHIIRMASTRAKARCLRDMTNIGMTCLEELGDFAEAMGSEVEVGRSVQPFKKDNVRKFPVKQAAQQENSDGGNPENENPIPNQEGAKVAVHSNTAVLPPVEVPTENREVARADSRAEKAHRVPAKSGQTVKAGNEPGNGKDKSDKTPLMSDAQKSAIYNLSRRRGISIEELENMAQETFNAPVENLSHENAVSFIRSLQQAA